MSIWAMIGQQFAKILLMLFVVFGILWVLEKLVFSKQRKALGIDKRPIWLEFTADLFPVVAFIFVLRSFYLSLLKFHRDQ
jgi:signal peptidase I